MMGFSKILKEYKKTRKLPKYLEKCLVILGVCIGLLFVIKFISKTSSRNGDVSSSFFRKRTKTAIVLLTYNDIKSTNRVLDGIGNMKPHADYVVAYRESGASQEMKKMTKQRCDYVRDVPSEIHEHQLGLDHWRPTQSKLRTTWLYIMTDLWSHFTDMEEVCYFEDDMYPHPQFLKILRAARKSNLGRSETTSQNEKKKYVCQTCRAGNPTDGGVQLQDGICREYCSRNNFCGSNSNYRNGGTDCSFLKTPTRVWSFKARTCEDCTNQDALIAPGDMSIFTPFCMNFEEFSLLIRHVGDDYCLQDGGGMNAWDIALMTLMQRDMLPPLRYVSENILAIHLKHNDWNTHEASIDALLKSSPSSKIRKMTPAYGGKFSATSYIDLSNLLRNDFENPGGWTKNRQPLREYVLTISSCFRMIYDATKKLEFPG